jgi:hypothetical protein
VPLTAAPLAPAVTTLPGVAGSLELHADSISSDVSALALAARSRILNSGLESEKRIIFTRLSLAGRVGCVHSRNVRSRAQRQTRQTWP